jgi:ketosteroid isomerase-like protein
LLEQARDAEIEPPAADAAVEDQRGVPPADTAGVEAALRRFLAAFEDLDWEAFRASFADDACVFFPSAATPHRFCGRDLVEARFRRVFDSIRREATSGL